MSRIKGKNQKAKNMTQVFEKFVDFYSSFSPLSLNCLEDIYDDKVIFQDPIARIEGLSSLRRHFESTMQGLRFCEFEITRVQGGDVLSYLEWNMHFSHPRLRSGKPISLSGISVIEAGEKVISHRDYYDMGEMVYENLPILRSIIKVLKNNLNANAVVT